MRDKYNDIRLSHYGLFVDVKLPYRAISDNILPCSCYEMICLEIKYLYLIIYAKTCYSNLEYLRRCDGKKTELKKSLYYFTKYLFQMAVTMETYFAVWTPHGLIVDKIYFGILTFKETQILKLLRTFQNYFQWMELY